MPLRRTLNETQVELPGPASLAKQPAKTIIKKIVMCEREGRGGKDLSYEHRSIFIEFFLSVLFDIHLFSYHNLGILLAIPLADQWLSCVTLFFSVPS